VDALLARTERIALFPGIRPYRSEVCVRQVREVIEGPYRILYPIQLGGIEVLAVFHGARRLSGEA